MTLAQIERLKRLRSKNDLQLVGKFVADALKKLQKQSEKKRC